MLEEIAEQPEALERTIVAERAKIEKLGKFLKDRHTDLIVLVGSNTAWCHPVLFKRISEARERGDVKVVVIDPRRTATCEIADLHLPVRAGTDVWLFNGLLAFLHQHGVVHTQFVAAHTVGRSCFAIELSPRYCDVIIERFEALTGEKADKLES